MTNYSVDLSTKPSKNSKIISIILICVIILLIVTISILSQFYISESEANERSMKYISTIFDDENIEIIETKKLDYSLSDYIITCTVSRTGDLFSYSFPVEVTIYRDFEGVHVHSFDLVDNRENDTDTGELFDEEKVIYEFNENDNFYYFLGKLGGNYKTIFSIDSISKDSINLDSYVHDLGGWGHDSFDHFQSTYDMTFNWEEMCFEYEYYGYWRIYPDRIEYLRYWINRGLEDDYIEISPVDPNDYWWFDEASNI